MNIYNWLNSKKEKGYIYINKNGEVFNDFQLTQIIKKCYVSYLKNFEFNDHNEPISYNDFYNNFVGQEITNLDEIRYIISDFLCS